MQTLLHHKRSLHSTMVLYCSYIATDIRFYVDVSHITGPDKWQEINYVSANDGGIKNVLLLTRLASNK